MAAAVILACIVIAVADGDTLTADCEVHSGQQTVVIRLSQIDAPERQQPWGEESRAQLSALCLHKQAVVQEESRDRYRRIVARVVCNGVDVGREQVRNGDAWVFDRYATDLALYSLQNEARARGLGLWRGSAPMPPWQWRASRH